LNLYNIYIDDGMDEDSCGVLHHEMKFTDEELKVVLQEAIVKIKDVNGFELMSDLRKVLIKDYNFKDVECSYVNIINLIKK
jgi:hypothetical protein